MRLLAVLACGFLAACTSSVTIPDDSPVLQEVPMPGTASSSTSGGDDFTRTIEDSLAADGTTVAGTLPQHGTPIDDDKLNLTLYTIERQKVDAAIAQRKLDEARAQLVVVQPGALPNRVAGVNIALYAQQTTNPVGQRIYKRSGGVSLGSNCGRYSNPDEAQRAFLASGGPETDRNNLDPDGDGFACRWDPTPYRQL